MLPYALESYTRDFGLLENPLPEVDILQAAEAEQWVSGIVRVQLSELVDCCGEEDFLDLMSTRLTGCDLLEQIEYDIVTVDMYQGVQHIQIKVSGDPASIAETIDTVECKFCHKDVPAKTAHLHEDEWVGDDCCWDERLRSTE